MWCKVTVLSPLVQFKVDSSSSRHSHCVCGDTVHGVSCLVPCAEQVYPKKCAAGRGSLLPLSPVPLASSLWGLSSVFLSGCPVGQHLRSPPPALLSLPTGTLLSSLFWEDRLIPTQQQCSLAGETSQSFGVWIHWAGVLHQLLLRGPGGASGSWDVTRHLLSSLSPFEAGSQNTLPTVSKEIFKNPLSLPLCPLSFSHPRCEGGVFRVSGS